jgi:sec-independent protein translocase protein TatB
VNLDPEKVVVLFGIALLVLGPNRLPQVARSLGKGLAEVRKYTSSFHSQVDDVVAGPRAIVESAVQHESEMRAGLERIGRTPTPLEGRAGPADRGPLPPAIDVLARATTATASAHQVPDDPALN